MRLSRSESLVLESSKDKILKNSRSKKKHKRLDAICEKVYTRNHNAVEKVELNEDDVGGNENEPRRSTRVRRAPEVLDASPMPPKKRRKIDMRGGMSSVDKGKRVIRVKSETLCSSSNDLEDIEENLSVWRSRLRARDKYVRFEGKAKGRRKPFEEFHEFKEETASGIRKSDNEEEFIGRWSSLGKSKRLGEGAASGVQESDKVEEFIGGSSFTAKSKRTPRVKVLSGLVNEDKEIDSPAVIGEEKEVNEELEDEDKEIDSPGGIGEEKKENDEVAFGSSDEGIGLVLNSGIARVHDDESQDGFGPSQVVEKEEMGIPGGSHSEEQPSNDDSEMQLDKQACDSVEHHIGDVENDGATEDKTKGGAHDSGTVEIDGGKDDPKIGEHLDIPLEAKSSEKFHNRKHALDNMQRPIKIKEGRRCGLCGGGTDGKPPKKLVQDGYGSDDEACSGGSASEEPNYDVWDGFGDEPSWLGRLLGPVNDRFGIAGIWVHQQCAVWSPEVYFAGLGCLKNVRAALYRGRVLKCSRCGRPGATIGCRVDRCPKTYHLPCARDSGCIFDHRKFLIACTDHRHIFQPHGSQYFRRLKKMKVKKMHLEIRKVSNDALRKDIEAEEKWLEHCGEDEEFLKRESKRLQRDLLRIAPTYIGGPGCNTEMQYQGWESVAGLQDVIRCMKEVVILPLLYPELFSNLGLTPPRGVLLHGYPGTGKTLVVRALIGSCARGDRRIAYFARKGADCLGKYVGDAERQLRLLFQVAEKSQPSIIFFDEIDGLAPCRTRQQDQTHSSVVSTLLALMDGLKSRGSVVVIGATNRPDTVDPALRRPGRFDREIYFPLPSVKDREAILSLHTQKWPKKIGASLLKWVARRAVGFAGADLQALCTQAAIIGLRRNFPLQEVLGGAVESALLSKRPPLPSVNVEERDWLDALSLAPPPCSHREAGIAANDVISSPLAAHLVPCLLQPLSKLIVSLYLDERVWLPPALHKAATLIKNVIVSALMEKKLLADKWWFHLQDLLQEADVLSKLVDKLSRTIILTDAFCSFDPVEDVADDRYLSFEPSRVQQVSVHTGLLHSVSYESAIKSGFRILISGEARSGQRHLASCLLHCFSGNIEIRKLDLATLFQEGHGDVIQGLTLILMKCVSVGSCILFLPRIDLWAVETFNQFCEDEKASPSSSSSVTEESSEYQNAVKRVTYLWNSFIEQVESICVRTPLMILATSDVPFIDLPFGVKQFFRCETLDCGLLNSYKDAVPRFLVEIDGDLSPDLLTDTSVGRLLMDLVQYFIHLLRRGIHANLSSEKNSKDIAELSADAINSSSDPGSTTEGENKRVTAPITSAMVHNPVKAKSSLLTAISSFGYQIVRYPHFAELCWVTSKLRDGPCARINGPWKGWPFNSCIVRPLDLKEGIDVTPTSNTAKNMDKSCVARGLIAVGLSAYRGEYTSLRAFLLEIRKVLELLVGCVDTKIQAGKDKYKFFRLLSQVAYFEDMVISWAYTLRSLEVDSPFLEESPRLNFTGCSGNPGTCRDSLCDGGKYKISNENLYQSEVLEQIPREGNAEHTSDHLLTDADLNVQNRAKEIAAACDEISVPMVLDHCASVVEVHSPLPNGISSETRMPMDVENQSEVGGNLEGSQHSNGFLQRDPSVILGDGPNVSGDKSGMGPSDPAEICKGDRLVPSSSHGIQLDHPVENSSGNSLRMDSRSNMSGLLCGYHCCSDCVVNFYQLLLKLLSYEWELKGSSVTVEDFHDFVASLSVSLQSAVRKLFVKDSPSNACDEKLMEQKCRKYTQCTQMCVSQRKNSQSMVIVPKECSCHSAGEGVSAPGNFSRNSQFGLDIKFFFRDGVLVAISDSDFTDPCHCNFEKLCLCSLVECIAMSKDFLD